MASTNITVDGRQRVLHELLCSPDFTVGQHRHVIFFTVFNSLLSIIAFFGNAMILEALHRVSSLHPPSKLLFRSLATTDLCVGLVSEPIAVVYSILLMTKQWNSCIYASITTTIAAYTLCSVSLLTLTAISVDRLLALHMGVRYRQVVTLKRTYVLVAVIWAVSIVGSTIYLLNPPITLSYGYTVISLCLLISLFSYAKIFVTLRHHQMEVHGHVQPQQPSQTISINLARYRKVLSSVVWLQLALTVCYLPQGIEMFLLIYTDTSLPIFAAGLYTTVLVYLNSSLNPIICYWKIKEVRQAAKDIIKQLCCRWTVLARRILSFLKKTKLKVLT